MITDLASEAKHAHPLFAETVDGYGREAGALLDRFVDLDDFDQALVVLSLARFAPNLLGFAFQQAEQAPCFSASCGHPRHGGYCEADDCECYR